MDGKVVVSACALYLLDIFCYPALLTHLGLHTKPAKATHTLRRTRCKRASNEGFVGYVLISVTKLYPVS